MAQLHGIGPQEFFIDLQGLYAVDVYPDAPDFQGAGIIAEHHLIAGLDTDKAVRSAEYIE
jgi:hypothetical protein